MNGFHPHRKFAEACEDGHLDAVQLMIEQGTSAWDWDWGLRAACRGGHMDIIHLMIEKGANAWNWSLRAACQGGHLGIVHMLIEKGANRWDWGLRGACRGGHLNIVHLMMEKGATRWDWGIDGACRGGHLGIAALMIDQSARDVTRIQTLSPDKQYELYNLVKKMESRVLLQSLPAIKERLRVMWFRVLSETLPDDLSQSIVAQYL